MKGWAEERVVKELGYLNLNEQTRPHGLEKESHYSRHLNFLRWLNRTFSKKVKIIDIGGGSGTLLHTILLMKNLHLKWVSWKIIVVMTLILIV